MAENPEIFTNTQKLEIARFRAQLNDREFFGVFDVTDDVWVIYDTQSTGEFCRHEDDPDAKTIQDCEYVDLWTS